MLSTDFWELISRIAPEKITGPVKSTGERISRIRTAESAPCHPERSGFCGVKDLIPRQPEILRLAIDHRCKERRAGKEPRGADYAD